MTKESIYELQKIDCCCNDCAFLIRDLSKPKEIVIEDDKNQLFFFRARKCRAILRARKHKDANKRRDALKAAISLKYNYFHQRIPNLYGQCTKFNKEVTFLPNTCQLDTQHCFLHRKNIIK